MNEITLVPKPTRAEKREQKRVVRLKYLLSQADDVEYDRKKLEADKQTRQDKLDRWLRGEIRRLDRRQERIDVQLKKN